MGPAANEACVVHRGTSWYTMCVYHPSAPRDDAGRMTAVLAGVEAIKFASGVTIAIQSPTMSCVASWHLHNHLDGPQCCLYASLDKMAYNEALVCCCPGPLRSDADGFPESTTAPQLSSPIGSTCLCPPGTILVYQMDLRACLYTWSSNKIWTVRAGSTHEYVYLPAASVTWGKCT